VCGRLRLDAEALDLVEMNLATDVRDRLAALRVPSVVLQVRADRVSSPEQGRFLAERIPGARLVEVDGDDHAFLFESQPRLLEELAALVRSAEQHADG
jgi:pimeloyl-ACP methyl ester carboxylesterase